MSETTKQPARQKWAEELVIALRESQGIDMNRSETWVRDNYGSSWVPLKAQLDTSTEFKLVLEALNERGYLSWLLDQLDIRQFLPADVTASSEIQKVWILSRAGRILKLLDRNAELRELRREVKELRSRAPVSVTEEQIAASLTTVSNRLLDSSDEPALPKIGDQTAMIAESLAPGGEIHSMLKELLANQKPVPA